MSLSSRNEVDFILDCEADPTGTADCAPAWDKAYEILGNLSASSKLPQQSLTLKIPPGLYAILGALATPVWDFLSKGTSLAIEGCGDASVILFGQNVSGPAIANAYRIYLRDLTCWGTSANIADTDCPFCFELNPFYLGSVERCKFANLYLGSFALGLLGNTGTNWAVRDCECSGNSATVGTALAVFWSDTIGSLSVENCAFTDEPAVNGLSSSGKAGTNGVFIRHDHSDTPTSNANASKIWIRNCFFDEACTYDVYVQGDAVTPTTGPVTQLRIDECSSNVPTNGTPMAPGACIFASDVQEVIVQDFVDGQVHPSVAPVPALVLESVDIARIRRLIVDPAQQSNFMTADANCGYVEVKDSPGLTVTSSATRTYVDSYPIAVASVPATTGAPNPGQGFLTTTLPGTPTASTSFPLVDGSFSGRVSIVGRLFIAGSGGGNYGDYFSANYLAQLKTVFGATTAESVAQVGTTTQDASFVGTTLTLQASGDALEVTVDATAAVSGAGMVADWLVTLEPDGNVFREVTPDQLAGLELWYRADLGVVMGASGVATWIDQSHASDATRNALQATAAQQPTLNASDAAYNNQATLSFVSAANQLMESLVWNTPLAAPYTIFVVGNDDAGGSEGFFGSLPDTRTPYALGGNYYAYSGGTFIGPSTTPRSANPNVFVVEMNGGASNLYVSDITAEATGALTNPNFTRSVVGTIPDVPGDSLNGKIAEVVVFNRILSLAERTALMKSYFGPRYGITIGP